MKIKLSLLFAVLSLSSLFVAMPSTASAHEGTKSSEGCRADGFGSRLNGGWANRWCIIGLDGNRYVHRSQSVAITQTVVWCKYAGQGISVTPESLYRFTDGNYGAETEAWVKRYQSDKGLPQDGIIGRSTLTSLANDVSYSRRSGDYAYFKVSNSYCSNLEVLAYDYRDSIWYVLDLT